VAAISGTETSPDIRFMTSVDLERVPMTLRVEDCSERCMDTLLSWALAV
jgi:hypothetical protein